MQPDTPNSFLLGSWKIVPLRGSAAGPSGKIQHLEPKVMDVLVCLALRANEVVTREQLLDVAWAGSATADEQLTRAISELRRTFHDDPGNPDYIETVPKRGYRLIQEISAVEYPSGDKNVVPTQPLNRFSGRNVGLFASVLLVLALAYVAFDQYGLKPPPEDVIADESEIVSDELSGEELASEELASENGVIQETVAEDQEVEVKIDDVAKQAVAAKEAGAKDNSAVRWYVVHAYSGFEAYVKKVLESRIATSGYPEKFGKILIPTEEVVEMKEGVKRKSERKFFPGYVLVQMVMDNDTWHLVKQVPKVLGFIGGTSDKPAPITEAEADAIVNRVEAGVDKPRPKVLFEVGEVVRVNDGPFNDFNGVVEEVNYEKSKMLVSVQIFGRSTPVELAFGQVEKG